MTESILSQEQSDCNDTSLKTSLSLWSIWWSVMLLLQPSAGTSYRAGCGQFEAAKTGPPFWAQVIASSPGTQAMSRA